MRSHRRVQLHRAASRRGARAGARRRPAVVRRAPAALQPRAPRGVRGRAGRRVRARGPRLRPVLRARERLPDRQVPHRRRRHRARRAPARARGYLDERGLAVLAVLDELAASHETTRRRGRAAWLAAQPTVAAPIASARTPEQLAELLPMAELELGGDELQRLSAASVDSRRRYAERTSARSSISSLRGGARDEDDLAPRGCGRRPGSPARRSPREPEAVARAEQRPARRRRQRLGSRSGSSPSSSGEAARDLVEIARRRRHGTPRRRRRAPS